MNVGYTLGVGRWVILKIKLEYGLVKIIMTQNEEKTF